MLLLLSLVVAVAVGSRVAMEGDRVRAVPRSEYEEVGPSTAASVELSFMLHGRQRQLLEEEWTHRSDPRHPSYGQWLSPAQLEALFYPLPQHRAAVRSALLRAGARRLRMSPSGITRARFSRSDAEALLGIRFWTFRNKRTGQLLHRSRDGRYSLPAGPLAEHVAFVEGVRRLPVVTVRPQILKKKNQRSFGLGITPKVARSHYGTTGIQGSAANNSMAVASFIGQFYSLSDLKEFQTIYDPQDAGVQPTLVGPNNGGPGVEADLDVQYLSAMGSHVKNFVVWSTPASDPTPFLDLFASLENATQVPMIFSISYGEDEDGNTGTYLDALNGEFMKVGLRGVSVLIAAGDSGVSATGQCPGNRFAPDWPATSPYVTAVGGTRLGFLDTGAERVWTQGGGGFSNHFARPAWQEQAVSSYLSKYAKSLPPSSYYNGTKRAYPDIAAFADNVFVVYQGVPTPVGGTSCATPISSGVFALLNDIQLQSGRSQLGPLNQWIYQNLAQFNDITEGRIEGCAGQEGFPATPSWDAASGAGSVNYPKLKAVLPGASAAKK